MAGSFQTAIIKTHSGRSLNEILKETIETGEGKWRDCYVSPRRCQHQTVWCVCGSFYKAFLLERRRKCLPPLGSPGARASCGKCSSLFYECWRTGKVGVVALCFLICSVQDPQTGRLWRAVNLDQLFKCEVRANTAVGFPCWMVKESLLQCCPVPCETLCEFTIQSWSDVLPLLSCSLMHTVKNRSCIGKKANEKCWTPDYEEAEEFTVKDSRWNQKERKYIATSKNTFLVLLPLIFLWFSWL